MTPITPQAPMQQPALAEHDSGRAKSVPVAYEPHCLMAWAEMVKGMDDMARYAGATA